MDDIIKRTKQKTKQKRQRKLQRRIYIKNKQTHFITTYNLKTKTQIFVLFFIASVNLAICDWSCLDTDVIQWMILIAHQLPCGNV